MADDEKILRIEAKITEETKKVSDKPTVSTGTGEEPDPAFQAVTDRSAYEKLDQDRQHQLEVEKSLSAIRQDEDTPLLSQEDMDRLLKPYQQLTAEEAFGPIDLERQKAVMPAGEGIDPTQKLADYYATLLHANAQAQIPAGAAPTPVPPLNVPPPILPPAGAVPAIGGAGGAIPPIAGNVAAGAGGAAGGGNLLATIGGLAVDAGALGAAFVALTAVLLAAEELLDSAFQALSRQWEEISPAINVAEANRELDLTLERLKTESKVAEPVSEVTNARADLDKTFIEVKAVVIQTIAPTLIAIMGLLADMLEVCKGILIVVKLILAPVNFILKLLGKIFFWVRDTLEGDTSEDVDFTKQIADIFADANLGSRAAGLNNQSSPLNMGGSFPHPHASQKGRMY